MKVIERYSAAVNSANLVSDPLTTWSDTDVLGAAGLAGRYEPLGLALTRLFADGRPEPTVSILTEMAFKRARTVNVRLSQVQAGDLSRAVLAWYRHGVCQPCGGTGFQVIKDTPVQGDECKHCRTSGKVPFESQFTHESRDVARWLSAEIDRAQVAAGRAAMAMLAPRLDI